MRRFHKVIPWVIWIALLAVGSVGLASYSGTSGALGSTPSEWPDHVLPQNDAGPTLVLMLHPRCSCSQATMSEVERLLSGVTNAPRVHLVFYVPEHADASWAEGRLWDRASRLDHAVAHADTGGSIAEEFGGLTSGHLAVYGPDGRLRFSGGLTSSRGHEGLSDGGLLARAALIEGGSPPRDGAASTQVYGCPIQEGGHD